MRRSKWSVGISKNKILIGAICNWGMAVLSLVWVLAAPNFDQMERVTLEGTVERVSETDMAGNNSLDLRLRGQEVRFRVYPGVYRSALDARIPSGLSPGSPATIQVPKGRYDEPQVPKDGVPTVRVDAIESDGNTILSLEASGAWHKKNGRMALYLLPIFLVIGLVLSVVWYRLD